MLFVLALVRFQNIYGKGGCQGGQCGAGGGVGGGYQPYDEDNPYRQWKIFARASAYM